MYSPIGVFDSGYGGLTVLKEITEKLPAYDYVYLGDNARAPYGSRSFNTVYHYTWQCVQWLFAKGCPLIILACNTASAKALRTIQQKNLEVDFPGKRVLGVIRPTTEIIGDLSKSGHIGILATSGTVQSESYPIEIKKFFPHTRVYQEACPMWVSLVENNEHNNDGADYFIKKHLANLLNKSRVIDTVLLACTHYPLLKKKIEQYLPPGIKLLSQAQLVANSLVDYLQRHHEIESTCSKGKTIEFFTTDSTEDFDKQGGMFYGRPVQSKRVEL